MPDNRHVGDLGNIITYPSGFSAEGLFTSGLLTLQNPSAGMTSVKVVDNLITLESGAENDISGKAFVVHAGEDDLGMGGDEESLKTGNAGKRLACGIVKPINY